MKKIVVDQMALHQIPELGYAEHKTHAYLWQALLALAPDALIKLADTGIKAVFLANNAKRTIAYRADIDALSIEENTGLPYASKHPGCMHACGHDAHMAIALSGARYAAALRNSAALKANCVFLFQPAEESIGGAQRMIEQGALEEPHVDEIYAMHVMPQVGIGSIGLKSGALMAATTELDITLDGRAAHGAAPHLGADAIAAGTHLYALLQTLFSRQLDPMQPVLFTVGRFTAGDRRNIIARHALLEAMLRSFSNESMQKALSVINEAALSLKSAFSLADVRVDPVTIYPAVMNDEGVIARLQTLLEDKAVPALPQMTAEDFSFFTQARPGAMLFLGMGGQVPLHSDKLIVTPETLYTGEEILHRIIQAG